MSPAASAFLSIDLPPMLLSAFTCVACGVLGNFLLLRRQSLMGDAIAHAVLPGLVVGFLLSGSRSPIPMFAGAVAAGLLTVALIGLAKRLGRVEANAAMGVVFPVMFALGVLILERSNADGVDLDPDCVLNGQLEQAFWLPPAGSGWLSADALDALPPEIGAAFITMIVCVGAVAIFFKELRLCAFDAGLASALGFRPGLIHAGFTLLVALAVVASFRAVGSILVIAMLVCPPAAARFFTDRLARQIWLSAGFALASALGGYAAAVWGPGLLGLGDAVNAAGMIAVVSGVLVVGAMTFAPAHGLVARRARRAALALRVAREDALASLYRIGEGRSDPHAVLRRDALGRLGVRLARARGEIEPAPDGRPTLTPRGREQAARVIRSHRLWETYLVREAGLRPDHVHDRATDLEHLRQEAEGPVVPDVSATRDPHDRAIPGA